MCGTYFRHGRMIVQMALLMLFSSITGTRPGVLLPETGSTVTNPIDGDGLVNGASCGDQTSRSTRTQPPRKSGQNKPFTSDLPEYVPSNDWPKTVCYGDIDLFVIKNPDGGSDVICAIIEFRNLKGLAEGVDG